MMTLERHLKIESFTCNGMSFLQMPCGTVLGHVYVAPVGNVSDAIRAASIWKESARALGIQGGPDLVVMSFHALESGPAGAQALADLPQQGLPSSEVSYLDSWTLDMSRFIDEIRTQLPEAALGWHTVPSLYGGPVIHRGGHILKRHHAEINSAIRALATSKRLVLVDYDQLAHGIPSSSFKGAMSTESSSASAAAAASELSSSDRKHNKRMHIPVLTAVALQAANIYLNLLNQLPAVPAFSQTVDRLKQLQQPRLPEPLSHRLESQQQMSQLVSHDAIPHKSAQNSVLLLPTQAAIGPGGILFDPAAPWMAPEPTPFPYKGLENDLDGLLGVQASVDRWITMVRRSGRNMHGIISVPLSFNDQMCDKSFPSPLT